MIKQPRNTGNREAIAAALQRFDALSKQFGNVDLCVGDDEKIYV
jgi:hypothetical protein